MPRCCDCLLTEAVMEHASLLLEAAAENHKWLLLGSVVAGSITAAIYFFKESNVMEEKLCQLTGSLRKVEAENMVLQTRARTLKRQRHAVKERAAVADSLARHTIAKAARLKRDDCQARTESGQLDLEVRTLWAKVRAVKRQRDSFMRRLKALLCSTSSGSGQSPLSRYTSLNCHC